MDDLLAIENGVLIKCNDKNASEVVIPEGVTTIEGSAFSGFASLSKVVFPNSLVSIETNAFLGCKSLEEIIIPASVRYVENYAFNGCSNLKKVTILSEEIDIEEKTFSGCNSLIFNEDGNGKYLGNDENPYLVLMSIQNSDVFSYSPNPKCRVFSRDILHREMFDNRKGLRLFIPKTITYIPQPDIWVYNYDFITSIYVEEGNPKYDSRENCNAIIEKGTDKLILGCTSTFIPSSIKVIGAYAFYNRSPDTACLILPDGLISVEDYAFAFCHKIDAIKFPKTLTHIGKNAFWENSYFTLSLPEGLGDIGEEAFSGCKKLTDVNIPASLYQIGPGVFNKCALLTKININEKNDFFFSGPENNSIVERKTGKLIAYTGIGNIPNGVKIVGKHFLCNKDGTKNVQIPKGIVFIETFAFSGAGIEKIKLPSTLKRIEEKAFYNSKLSYIDFPEGLEYIGPSSFDGCRALEKVNLPEGLTSIERWAFQTCGKLKEISIPSSLVDCRFTSVFQNCPSLSKIVVDKNNPQYDSRDNCNAIIETKTNTLVLGSCETVIPASVEVLGCGCMSQLNFTSIVLNEGLKEIGEYAFYLCENLTSVTLPKSLQKIGESAFWGCDKLKVVNYPGDKKAFKAIKIGPDNSRMVRKVIYQAEEAKEVDAPKPNIKADVNATENSQIAFTLKRQKNEVDDIYNVELNCDGKKSLLEPKILIGKRYMFAMEDYLQLEKGKYPVFRFMRRDYSKDLDKVYENLPESVKKFVDKKKFITDLNKKLEAKKVKTITIPDAMLDRKI